MHDDPGGEQRRRAVANVVVSVPLDISETQGQHRLGPIQSLDLGFLIDAQHHRVVGRIEVESHDVPDFLDKEGVGGQFERLSQVRLDAKSENQRRTVVLDRPSASAIRHTLQFSALAGLSCRARLISPATFSSS